MGGFEVVVGEEFGGEDGFLGVDGRGEGLGVEDFGVVDGDYLDVLVTVFVEDPELFGEEDF